MRCLLFIMYVCTTIVGKRTLCREFLPFTKRIPVLNVHTTPSSLD